MKLNSNSLLRISIITIHTALIIFLTYYFIFKSNGFVAHIYSSDGSIGFSREYQSSGSDDNGVMFLFFGTRIILLILSFFSSPFKALLLCAFIFIFEFFCLSLISDTSNIGKTIAYNKAFLIWFLAWLSTVPVYFLIFIKSKKSAHIHIDKDYGALQ
jgi:hypothetical protein